MNVLFGKDAIFEVYKNGSYLPFVCCESFEMTTTTETISVLTLGDGTWAKNRGQGNSWTGSISGLWPYDDDVNATFLDLLDYQRQMVPIVFRIVYNKQDGSLYQQVKGQALVTNSTITSPVDFVSGTISLLGDGAYEITDILDVCTAAITSATFTVDGTVATTYHVAIIAVTTGTVPRYDYRVNGGSTLSKFNETGWPVLNISTGDILEIWPVCDNGLQGTKYTHTF